MTVKSLLSKKCNHTWEHKFTTNLKSPFQQLVDAGLSHAEIINLHLGPAVFKIVSISVMTCTTCGSIDKTLISTDGRNL